jgi:predicted  nucleic acid-binding Zn-ribbon protein
MSAALGLYRLQQVDSQLDQVRARRKWIQDTLQNDISLRAAAQTCAASENKSKETSHLLKSAETEVEKQRIKIQQTESNLYSGNVHNPKELQDLQKDIISLKKYLETLEERELEAMIQAESAEKELQSAKADLERTQANVNEQNRDLSQENGTLEKELERLGIERRAVFGNLAGASVEIYDQLRKQRRGIAVTKVNDSACEACGTTLTPSQQQSARSTSQFFYCPSCGRIMYSN